MLITMEQLFTTRAVKEIFSVVVTVNNQLQEALIELQLANIPMHMRSMR